MKLFATSIALLVLLLNAFSQNNKLDEYLEKDLIIKGIYEHLPDGWVMEINDTEIKAYRVEKIAVINKDCGEIDPDSLHTIDRTETAMVLFRHGEKWDADKIFFTREWNDSLNLRLAMLPQEYGVSHLLDTQKSSRFHKVYTGRTPKEKEQVEKFNRKRSELISQINYLPNLNTSTRSLHLIKRSGLIYSGNCVIPQNAYKEAMAVYVLFLDYCENPLMQKK